jgi:N,N-dimethylformamidase beta subunit-like protein/Big-like domain-containing protein
VNRVACENTASGNDASEWDVAGSGDPSIQGFATAISANRGETVHFKINTNASLYHLEIYRMGYYGGAGARKVAIVRPSAALPQSQPSCAFTPGVNLVDCGNWAESSTWAVPANAASGIYFAKLVRDSGDFGSSHVVFIVRDDASSSALLYQTSDTTWQAYNNYGGNSFYENGAVKVSYNRPMLTRDIGDGRTSVFGAEYPMVRWLEANGYDVTYFTGVDTDINGGLLTRHKVFMSSGHDEYWSGSQRANVESALASGVNLTFFTGNTMYWKTRWENNHRTLVCYKETTQKTDPSSVWTGLWRDPRFSPPSDGGRPENAVTGALYAQNTTLDMTVPADDGKMRLWRGTSIAQQSPGQVATLPFGVLGNEWDESIDTGGGGAFQAAYGLSPTGALFRPAGLVELSTTEAGPGPLEAGPPDPELQAPGSRTGAKATDTVVHHMTLYRAPSGALVFNTATMQWSWGLDAIHDGAATPTDPSMQQATVNMLADMGVQPATLQAGLVAASKSTDATKPSSVINPVPLARVNQPVTISGSAQDSGGVVGAVEVSTDGGQTWNPATGRAQWSFEWTPTQTGAVTIRSRATDDSANLEQPGPGLAVVVVP